MEAKRPPRPVNITTNVKLSPTVSNCVQISWSVDYNKTFCVAAYLVRKLSSSQLLERLEVKGIKPAEHTRGLSEFLSKLRANHQILSQIPFSSWQITCWCRLRHRHHNVEGVSLLSTRQDANDKSVSCNHLFAFAMFWCVPLPSNERTEADMELPGVWQVGRLW